ncbi:hypothetical protein ACTXJ1_10375 [Brachybacterium alimentarium]|uniref:hypothetical protein n=1 Tax=Brachybacterium alimentarium TaxID=47845 RepID=UPI003FD505E9
MRTTIARALVAPAAIALILAGCGNSGSDDTAQADTPEPAAAEADVDEAGDDAPTPTGHGTYTATTPDGTVITVTLPGDTPADVEDYRETVGVDPVGYVTVDIDNTNGSEYFNVSDVNIVDAEGETHNYESASSIVGDWGPTMRDDGPEGNEYYYVDADGNEISEDEYDTIRAQGEDVYEAYAEDGAEPHAKATGLLIGDDEVPSEVLYVEAVSAMEPIGLDATE